MSKATTCGHEPYEGKGLCRKCYRAAYYRANREREKARAAAWARENPQRRSENIRAWNQANQDAVRRHRASYYEAHAEFVRGRVRERARANPEAVKARYLAWKAANPERARLTAQTASNKRRAQKRAGGTLTQAEWVEVLHEHAFACAYCLAPDEPLELDHIVPLARGGLHVRSNVAPACARCNRYKGSRLLADFLHDLTEGRYPHGIVGRVPGSEEAG
jgi:5-methylcytosine-specific restriction endonuclease McrA